MSAGNIARSGASYEAVLVDHVTGSIDTIVHSLKRLEAAFAGVEAPARQVNAALASVAATGGRLATELNRDLLGGLTSSLTKFRTLALSGGQALSQALSTVSVAARSAGYALIGAGAAASGAIGYFVSLSAAAEETQNKFNVIFGDQAASMEKWVKSFGTQVGRAESTLKGFAADFRASMEETEQSPEAIDAFAKALTQLTIDIGSFQNRADQDVFQRLISGLNGSTEAVEILNINLRKSSLEKQMVKLGMAGKFDDLDDGQKKLLRLAAIVEYSKHSMDDATETAGSFSNSVKRLGAVVTNAGEIFGKVFEKTLAEPLSQITKAVEALGAASASLDAGHAKAFFGAIVAAVGIGTGLVGVAMAAATAAGLVITLSTALSGLAALASFALVAPFAALGVVLAGILASVLAVGAGLAVWDKVFSLETFQAVKAELEGIFDLVNMSLRGLATAVALGDWAGAAEIATLTFKVAFKKLTLDIVSGITNALYEGLMGAMHKFFRMMPIVSLMRGEGFFPDDFGLPPAGGLEKGMMADLNRLAELMKKMREEAERLPKPGDIVANEAENVLDKIKSGISESMELARYNSQYLARESKSVGSTASLFAANASSFGPTFKPEVQEAKKTNKLLGDNNDLAVITNEKLTELANSEWKFK